MQLLAIIALISQIVRRYSTGDRREVLGYIHILSVDILVFWLIFWN